VLREQFDPINPTRTTGIIVASFGALYVAPSMGWPGRNSALSDFDFRASVRRSNCS
jgi:hypothetical protein